MTVKLRDRTLLKVDASLPVPATERGNRDGVCTSSMNKHITGWVTVGMLSISILLALPDIITLEQLY